MIIKPLETRDHKIQNLYKKSLNRYRSYLSTRAYPDKTIEICEQETSQGGNDDSK